MISCSFLSRSSMLMSLAPGTPGPSEVWSPSRLGASSSRAWKPWVAGFWWWLSSLSCPEPRCLLGLPALVFDGRPSSDRLGGSVTLVCFYSSLGLSGSYSDSWKSKSLSLAIEFCITKSWLSYSLCPGSRTFLCPGIENPRFLRFGIPLSLMTNLCSRL